MIAYTYNVNNDKNSDSPYILYSIAMNAFFRLSDKDKNKILNNLNITIDKFNSLFPGWLRIKEKTLSKDDTISIIEFNKLLKLISDKLQQMNNDNSAILNSHTDSEYAKLGNDLISAASSYLEHCGSLALTRVGAKWVNWLSFILTLKDAQDFNADYLKFKNLIDNSNKFYELNYNLSMSIARYFVYINDNKENSISTYSETLERVNNILINLNNLFLFLKQNGIPYEKKSDVLSALLQINEIFINEKNQLVTKINDLKEIVNDDEDYGWGY
ncbi:hypothetical protein ACNQ1X_03205 [Mycoplasma sp. SK341A]|uniref:hypothetical protein n=1 Tax=unclassified Mycoplasma TaxID=2683645 RepID=UPI003AACB5B2